MTILLYIVFALLLFFSFITLRFHNYEYRYQKAERNFHREWWVHRSLIWNRYLSVYLGGSWCLVEIDIYPLHRVFQLWTRRRIFNTFSTNVAKNYLNNRIDK